MELYYIISRVVQIFWIGGTFFGGSIFNVTVPIFSSPKHSPGPYESDGLSTVNHLPLSGWRRCIPVHFKARPALLLPQQDGGVQVDW